MFIQVCNRFLCKKKRLLFLFSPDNNLLSFYVECKFVHQLEGVQDLPDGSMTIDFPRVKNRFHCFVLIMGVVQMPGSQCFHDLFQGLPVKGKHAVFPGCIIIHVHGLLQQCFPGSVVIPLFARFQDDPLIRSADPHRYGSADQGGRFVRVVGVRLDIEGSTCHFYRRVFQANQKGRTGITLHVEITFTTEIYDSFTPRNESVREAQTALGIQKYGRAVGQQETEFSTPGYFQAMVNRLISAPVDPTAASA